jgi:elongation factor G
MATDISKIRNVGFVGHGGVGKTSLVEAILFAAGATNWLGKVEDGTTTTDFDPDEIKRKISLGTSVAFCDWKGHHFNLIDTPGYGDFVADARAGLRVVTAAVIVVDAVAGVQVQTEKVWKYANEYASGRTSIVPSSPSRSGSRGGCVRSRCPSAARRVSRGSSISSP